MRCWVGARGPKGGGRALDANWKRRGSASEGRLSQLMDTPCISVRGGVSGRATTSGPSHTAHPRPKPRNDPIAMRNRHFTLTNACAGAPSVACVWSPGLAGPRLGNPRGHLKEPPSLPASSSCRVVVFTNCTFTSRSALRLPFHLVVQCQVEPWTSLADSEMTAIARSVTITPRLLFLSCPRLPTHHKRESPTQRCGRNLVAMAKQKNSFVPGNKIKIL